MKANHVRALAGVVMCGFAPRLLETQHGRSREGIPVIKNPVL